MVHTWLLVCDGFRLKPIWGGQTVFNPKGKVCPCQGGNDLPLTVGLARLTPLNESFSTFEPTEYHNFRRRRFGKAAPGRRQPWNRRAGTGPGQPLPPGRPGIRDDPALAAGPNEDLWPSKFQAPGLKHRSADAEYWNDPSRSHIP